MPDRDTTTDENAQARRRPGDPQPEGWTTFAVVVLVALAVGVALGVGVAWLENLR